MIQIQMDKENTDDIGLKTLLNCLHDFCDYTDFSDEFDICREIILWIESKDDLYKVEDITKLMPNNLFSCLLNFLQDFCAYSGFEDEIELCHQVEERLKTLIPLKNS